MAKRVKAAQRRAPGPEPAVRLQVRHELAIDLILAGHSDREVGEHLHCGRSTVTRWRASPLFRAALDRRRHDLWGASIDRLRALVPRAVEVLAGAVEAGDLRAATDLLKGLRLLGWDLPPPALPRDPDAELERQARADVSAEDERRRWDLFGETDAETGERYSERVAGRLAELRAAAAEALADEGCDVVRFPSDD